MSGAVATPELAVVKVEAEVEVVESEVAVAKVAVETTLFAAEVEILAEEATFAVEALVTTEVARIVDSPLAEKLRLIDAEAPLEIGVQAEALGGDCAPCGQFWQLAHPFFEKVFSRQL